MPNANTIVLLNSGTSVGTIPTLSNIGTTETVFTVTPNPITLTGGGAAVINVPQIFDSGKPFKIRAQGVVTTNVASNVAVNLYLGSSTNVSNDTAVLTMTPINSNSQTTQFEIVGEFQWDSTSKKVNGNAQSRLRGTFASPAAVTAVTANNASTLQFVVSGVFGAGNVGNTLTLTEFACEQV
jgi:hypothetical protein